MRFLRIASTRRLLAMIASVAAVIAAGTAIAVAASGGGPVPRPESLATAIRGALNAPAVSGITAQITFTNRLIDASSIQSSDPLLTGATGRLWLSADHRLRLELQSDNGDAQLVAGNGKFWVYDPSSKTVYQGTLPAGSGKPSGKETGKDRSGKHGALPSVAQIQAQLNQLMHQVLLSKAIPGDIAGQPTYTVRVSPQHDGGLLGAVQLAWDSIHGVPLSAAVYARGDKSPVLELRATHISFGRVPVSSFAVTPPSGSRVVKVSSPAAQGSAKSEPSHKRRKPDVSGVGAVAKVLQFKLLAPSKLVGLPRRTVKLLDWGGSPAALVAFGQNLGGIVVIEQKADPKAGTAKSTSGATGAKGDSGAVSLPTVSINGVTGQELDTALGTMVRFTRGGVAYTVLGSVPPAAADAAARAL